MFTITSQKQKNSNRTLEMLIRILCSFKNSDGLIYDKTFISLESVVQIIRLNNVIRSNGYLVSGSKR